MGVLYGCYLLFTLKKFKFSCINFFKTTMKSSSIYSITYFVQAKQFSFQELYFSGLIMLKGYLLHTRTVARLCQSWDHGEQTLSRSLTNGTCPKPPLNNSLNSTSPWFHQPSKSLILKLNGLTIASDGFKIRTIHWRQHLCSKVILDCLWFV